MRHILVEDCLFWNAEFGNTLEIGYETRCDEITDVVFKNCDVVHCQYEGNQSGGVLTIHNADRAHVHDIVYENIRIEDAQEKFIDIKTLDSKYSRDRERGMVNDIFFKNIEITEGAFPVSIIRGFEMKNEVCRPHNGYKRALEKNGLEYDEKLIIRLKPGKRIYTIENGYNCTCELLKSGVDFSCIYAISDTLAVGACRAIIDSGKRVPEDYCVAGADGQDIAEYYHPSITTLKYPRVETAQQSVRTLFDLIDRKKVVKRQILGGTLIERESTRKL